MAQVTIVRAEIEGDAVHVTGTVDGNEVRVRVWKSHLDTLGNRAAKVAYVAGELKATAVANGLLAPTRSMLDLAATVDIP